MTDRRTQLVRRVRDSLDRGAALWMGPCWLTGEPRLGVRKSKRGIRVDEATANAAVQLLFVCLNEGVYEPSALRAAVARERVYDEDWSARHRGFKASMLRAVDDFAAQFLYD